MVPADVIDYIFTFLQTDHTTLRECSKAHPFLAQLVQRHLYFCIAVQNHPTRNDPKLLPSEILTLSAEQPEILHNVVRGLSIELLPLPKAEMKDSLQDITSILSIFVGLPKLTSITLKARSPVVWRKLDDDFTKAILSCIRSPSVTELSIQDIIGFDLSELGRCKGLKRLSLQGKCRVPQSIHYRWLERNQLEYLSLSNFSPLLNLFFYWAPLTNLRVLDFHSSNTQGFSGSLNLIRRHSRSLTCLRFDLGDSFHSCYYLDGGVQTSSLSFIRLPLDLINLRHVTFHAVCYIKSSNRLYFSPLPDIARSLQDLLDLKSVTLRLHFKVEDEFVFHKIDVQCIHSMLAYPFPLHRDPPHIRLQISAVYQSDETTIPPSKIHSSLEQDDELMDMVNCKQVFFTPEGHFCRHFSCCSQDISAYIPPPKRQ